MHSSDEWARRRRARAEAARKKKIRKLQFLTAAICLLVILTVTAVWLHNGTPNGANPGQNTSAGNQGGLPEGTEPCGVGNHGGPRLRQGSGYLPHGLYQYAVKEEVSK